MYNESQLYVIQGFFLHVHTNIYFIFWLCWVFSAACRLSLAVESRGYSLGMMPRLLIVVVSVVEHRLWRMGVSSCSTWALESGLSGCGAWA